MTRNGTTLGLLHQLHASGCDGQEYVTLHPVVVPDEEGPHHDFDRAASIEVVIMAWCGECHAAEWDLV